MVERATGSELLLPCLLDRLTDDNPTEQAESHVHRASVKQYREAVLRDLNWLLNTASHPSEDELEGFDNVLKSVINYGIRNFGGQNGALRKAKDLERQIHEAILIFEPRILPDTLKVSLVAPKESRSEHDHCILGLEIHGDLWLEPLPEHLYIKTSIDLETGECVFKNQ